MPHYHNQGWNELRILAEGPRIQTWVNGHQIEDHTNEAVYHTHPKGFIGLQFTAWREKGPLIGNLEILESGRLPINKF